MRGHTPIPVDGSKIGFVFLHSCVVEVVGSGSANLESLHVPHILSIKKPLWLLVWSSARIAQSPGFPVTRTQRGSDDALST